jgi:hypothetical protein
MIMPDIPEVSIAFFMRYWIFPHKAGGLPLVFFNVVASPLFYVLEKMASSNRCLHTVFTTCPGCCNITLSKNFHTREGDLLHFTNKIIY